MAKLVRIKDSLFTVSDIRHLQVMRRGLFDAHVVVYLHSHKSGLIVWGATPDDIPYDEIQGIEVK